MSLVCSVYSITTRKPNCFAVSRTHSVIYRRRTNTPGYNAYDNFSFPLFAGRMEKTYHPFREANAGFAFICMLRERNNDETRRTKKPYAFPEQPSVPAWSRKT